MKSCLDLRIFITFPSIISTGISLEESSTKLSALSVSRSDLVFNSPRASCSGERNKHKTQQNAGCVHQKKSNKAQVHEFGSILQIQACDGKTGMSGRKYSFGHPALV